MEQKYFIWDDTSERLVLSGPTKTADEKKKDQRRKSHVHETKIFCPHKNLIFQFKETPNFAEQTRYRKHYVRPQLAGTRDVIMLQDVKDLVLYLLSSPSSLELISFLHLPIVDRFLRCLILYMQAFLITWTELSEKRAASSKRAPNPLAGGARVQRAEEMKCLRCLLTREYADLIMGSQSNIRKYHHARGGAAAFTQSNPEKDIRIFEGLIQLAHRIVWIALERKHKDLIEVEMHRLFRSDFFNSAKRKYSENEWRVPEEEHWILYGPPMPPRQKIVSNSPLPYEILNTSCDYRTLSIGFPQEEFRDPRIAYLNKALLAKEEDLEELGIKLGILGLPRADFDLLLIPQASEEEEGALDEAVPSDDEEKPDEYATLMPLDGTDLELTKPFPMEKLDPCNVGDQRIRKNSKKKWIKYASSKFTEDQVISIMN